MSKLMAASATLIVTSSLLAAGCVARQEREVNQTRNPPVVRHDVVVERPPMPSPRVEVRTIAPGPTYHWIDGRYEWNGHAWQWQPGYWAP